MRGGKDRLNTNLAFIRRATLSFFARFDPHARFRAVVDEVTAHGGTTEGTIRSMAGM
jgi:hypothetical protein